MENLKSKYVKTSIAIAAGLLAVTGCSKQEVAYNYPGTVMEHTYDDPDTYVVLMPAGKAVIPITEHDSAHWYLSIEQCDRKDLITPDNTKGCGTFKVEVPQKVYDDYSNGQEITLHSSK